MHMNKTYLLICGMLLVPPAWSETLTLSIANQSIQAEVVATPQGRDRGLMHRKQLCKNCGMLFVFEYAGSHVFWMKDTELPLTIAFIGTDGNILNIAEMQPNTTREYSPDGLALYTLEMNSGWFSRNGIKPKDKVHGLQRAPRGQ